MRRRVQDDLLSGQTSHSTAKPSFLPHPNHYIKRNSCLKERIKSTAATHWPLMPMPHGTSDTKVFYSKSTLQALDHNCAVALSPPAASDPTLKTARTDVRIKDRA